jgi:hypothetical protein
VFLGVVLLCGVEKWLQPYCWESPSSARGEGARLEDPHSVYWPYWREWSRAEAAGLVPAGVGEAVVVVERVALLLVPTQSR